MPLMRTNEDKVEENLAPEKWGQMINANVEAERI